MAQSFNPAAYQRNLANRENRKKQFREADTPIRDIRLYFTYEVPATYHYLYNFTDIIGRILHQKKFSCPGYSHIYIAVGENEEEAIARANELEDWYRFGIAVLSKEKLFNTQAEELEALMLQVIAHGLYDLSSLDKLDTVKIEEAIQLAAEWGITQERVLKENESRKYLFRITLRPIVGSKDEEIFFALTDRENQQVYKWKFGELSKWDAGSWFFKINVTNKLIRTKPMANMELALMGKRLELEMSVEKIKDGTGLLKLEDTAVPIDAETLKLSKMVSIDLNRPKTEVSGMIFAAGLGTRFKPWTDKHPKALAIVNGKSLLQRNIEYLQQYDIRHLIINVHHFADQVREAIDKNKGWGSKIIISDETDELLETGGGLKKVASLFTAETIVIINADILTDLDLQKMLQYHREKKSLATLATTNRNSSRYFLFDDQQTLCGWRNVKTGEEKISRQVSDFSQKAFSGIHVIDKRLLSLINRTGKFSMVDVYLDLARTEKILSFDHSGSRFIDVGKPESVIVAESMFV